MPPKYAFGEIDYFKLVLSKTQKTQEKPVPFPVTAWKNLDGGPAPGSERSSQIPG